MKRLRELSIKTSVAAETMSDLRRFKKIYGAYSAQILLSQTFTIYKDDIYHKHLYVCVLGRRKYSHLISSFFNNSQSYLNIRVRLREPFLLNRLVFKHVEKLVSFPSISSKVTVAVVFRAGGRRGEGVQRGWLCEGGYRTPHGCGCARVSSEDKPHVT